jgi:hypothetical protein
MATDGVTHIAFLIGLNSLIFTFLALNFLVICRGKRTVIDALRRDWPSALILGVFGFLTLLLVPLIVFPSWIIERVARSRQKEPATH